MKNNIRIRFKDIGYTNDGLFDKIKQVFTGKQIPLYNGQINFEYSNNGITINTDKGISAFIKIKGEEIEEEVRGLLKQCRQIGYDDLNENQQVILQKYERLKERTEYLVGSNILSLSGKVDKRFFSNKISSKEYCNEILSFRDLVIDMYGSEIIKEEDLFLPATLTCTYIYTGKEEDLAKYAFYLL